MLLGRKRVRPSAEKFTRLFFEEEMGYITTLPWREDKTRTLVIHCGDHRFQSHIDEFVRVGLGRPSFDRLVLPGGPQFLIVGSYLPKFEWAGRRWAKFLAKQHSLSEVICIGHEDCGWYKDITVGSLTIPLLRERQKDDLRKARMALQEMRPGVAVELFFAEPKEKNVEFLAVD